jgi:protein SCO1/2
MARNRFLLLGVGALIALVSVFLSFTAREPARFNGSLITPAQQAPEFELQDQNGSLISPGIFLGRVVLLYFGYTACSDICPATLSDMKRVKKNLDKLGNEVALVFITLDPRRDTSDRLSSYLASFDAGITGLTGQENTMAPVWQAYGISRAIIGDENGDNYQVEHTTRLFIIDQAGNLRLTYPFGFPVDQIIADIRLLLRD